MGSAQLYYYVPQVHVHEQFLRSASVLQLMNECKCLELRIVILFHVVLTNRDYVVKIL